MNKDEYSRMFLQSAGIEFDDAYIAACRTRWWANIRNGPNGLRLTPKGLIFAKDRAKLTTYTIGLATGFTVNATMIIWIDRYIKSPYYILYDNEERKYSILVFTEAAALELHLYAGDLNQLLHADQYRAAYSGSLARSSSEN